MLVMTLWQLSIASARSTVGLMRIVVLLVRALCIVRL